MKIIHIDFTGTFDEKSTYQGVLLPKAHTALGHDVIVLTTCFQWEKGEIKSLAPNKYILSDGTVINRLPYIRILGNKVTSKVRKARNVNEILQIENPDIIMVHGMQTFSLLDIVKYCKDNKNVWLCADNHADANNSAKNFISKLLHATLYNYIIRCAYPFIKKIYFTTIETKQFLVDKYGLDDLKTEYLPLGGHVYSLEEKQIRYQDIREKLKISVDKIVIVHAGKFDMSKKTLDVLKAFISVESERLELWLCGSAKDEIKLQIENAMSTDSRIHYLDWISGEELEDILVAADLYLQPGTQSAIQQNAVCCRTATAVYPYISYKYLMGEYSFYVSDSAEIRELLEKVLSDQNILYENTGKLASLDFETMDYLWQARHIVEEAVGEQ